MSADPLTDIANRDTRLKRLFAVVRQNQRAAAVLNASLPPGLAGQFRVVRIEQGEVLIFARTGGVAGSFGLAQDPSEFSLACRQTGPIHSSIGYPSA